MMILKGRNQSSSPLLLCALMAALVAVSAASVEDQKTTYSYPSPPTDPGSHTPSTPSGHPPSGGHHHTPSGGTPPSSNCGTPPSGGHHTPTPSTPSYSPPYTPTTPTTPTPSFNPPPTPIDPGTPTTPTPFFNPPPTPIDPGTPSVPGITIPSPPFTPSTPPFTCIYWLNHPTLAWGLLGWVGTVGGALGSASGTHVPGFGSNMSLMDALRNTRTDGYGELYREGTASFLNSMVPNARFPYSTQQVRDRFVASLGSNKAAANQARIFKLANEGRVKH